MAARTRRSTGNVFRDLGFPAAEALNLQIRADLMVQLTRVIEDQGLTPSAAARLLGVTQPGIVALLRGKIGRFTIDSLVAMLGRAGTRVSLVVGRRQRVA